MTPPIRLFVLDDHELIRRGVRELMDEEDDIEVVGEAATAADALKRVPATRPDVAVIDLRLPDGDGISVCREIRSLVPETHCIVFTSYRDEDSVMQAILAGASAFVLKATSGDELLRAVRLAAEGRSLLDPDVTADLLQRLRSPAPDSKLAEQEQKVLDLIAEGLTNRQIGAELHLAEQTVKNYVSAILQKLGLEHRTQAALYASKRKRDYEA
jgi:DNA-binding NarL/FixJ family response regulator